MATVQMRSRQTTVSASPPSSVSSASTRKPCVCGSGVTGFRRRSATPRASAKASADRVCIFQLPAMIWRKTAAPGSFLVARTVGRGARLGKGRRFRWAGAAAAPAPAQTVSAKGGVLFESSKSPYPFVLSITFRGSCMFRYEADKRDRDERYLGTLEVTQDLTKVRALEGERRLLEYDAPTPAGVGQ